MFSILITDPECIFTTLCNQREKLPNGTRFLASIEVSLYPFCQASAAVRQAVTLVEYG